MISLSCSSPITSIAYTADSRLINPSDLRALLTPHHNTPIKVLPPPTAPSTFAPAAPNALAKACMMLQKGNSVVKGGGLTGALAFVIVLLFMPIGHTLMVLNEQVLGASKLLGAGIMGTLGAVLLVVGVRSQGRALRATLLGLLSGILVWTGWVEFSFVWIAEKHGVAPHMEGDEVATKPEYLVMVSSVGLLASMLLFFLFTHTRCGFFVWFQQRLGLRPQTSPRGAQSGARSLAIVTFIETVMIIWAFYLLLLLAYDPELAGDRHPITWLVAFGSLAWSAWLMARLLRIHAFDHALRYAVPTVVIFWNFIEVAGRWGLFKEIWVHPLEHWVENSLIALALLLFVGRFVIDHAKHRQIERMRVG